MRRRRNVLGAFAPSDFPKTIAQVNKHLRELGIPVTARSGGSYYYFLDDAGNPVTDASVFTYRASGQTFSMWEADARAAAKKAAEDNAVEAPTRIVLRRRLDGIGAFTSNADLDKFKYRITKKQDGHVLRVYDGKELIGAVGAITRGCDLPGFESYGEVVSGNIVEGYRGRKLYQEMLLRLRKHLKDMGCKGLKSHGYQRSKMADRAWRKLNPRAVPDKQRPDVPGYDVLYLDGLGGVVEDLGITLKSGKRDGMPVVRALWNGEEVGFVGYSGCAKGQYAQIEDAFVSPRVRGMGVYPALLSALRDKVKKKGCKGLISNDRTPEATASWERLAEREPRVRRQGDTFMLEGLGKLPKKGRIPLATVKRAAAKLPKWTRKCGFTIAQLREGMEVEREHADVTRRGAFKTAQIAAAHLCEFKGGGYYPGLKRLEKRLKRRK